MEAIRCMHGSVMLLSQVVRYRTHLQCKGVTCSLTHGPGWATFLVPDPKRMDMSTRNDTNDQNKAADEAARTARTVTNETARVGEPPFLIHWCARGVHRRYRPSLSGFTHEGLRSYASGSFGDIRLARLPGEQPSI